MLMMLLEEMFFGCKDAILKSAYDQLLLGFSYSELFVAFYSFLWIVGPVDLLELWFFLNKQKYLILN